MTTRDRGRGPARGVAAALATLLLAWLALAPAPASAAEAGVDQAGVDQAGVDQAGVDQAGSGEVRMVVVSGAPNGATAVAAQVAALPGAAVVDPRPAGRSLTVTVPASSAEELTRAAERLPGVAVVVPEMTYELLEEPDDPQYVPLQRTSLAALHLPRAWDVTHGSADVRLAVLDTGAALDHPDLAGKVVGTYDAVTGGTDVEDLEGHGTEVASAAAASTGNGVGMAGSGWATSLLVVKVASSDGTITNGNLADGIDWAVAHGADVINLSLGSTWDDAAVRAAVARAVDQDVVVVAAAGNGGSSVKFYPAALPGVTSVGATTVGGGARASFSEYGSWVDVGAPGGSILVANAAWASGPDYVQGSGTSFASPLVAGVAALVRASRPDLDAYGVRAAVQRTASATDYGFAHGLVDAYAALGYELRLAGPDVAEPDPGDTVSGPLTVRVLVPGGVTADRVRAGFEGGPGVDAEVQDGGATLEVPTDGFSGAQQVRVVLCRQTLCSATGTEVPVTVANPVPTITSPADGTRLLADVTLAASSTAARVRYVADDRQVLGTVGGPGFELVVPITELSPGAHEITALACDASGTRCADGQPSAGVGVTVARLDPGLTSLSPNPFSPDDDGRHDRTRFTVDLDVASTATLRVVDSADSPVRTFALGPQPAGVHSVVWDGRRDDGSAAPSATYRVLLETSAHVAGEDLSGRDSGSVTLDRVDPHLVDARTTYPTVYPVRDGYRDATTLSVRASERVAKVTVTVYDARGKPVWSASKEDLAAGVVGASFSGRSSSGAVLAPGRYSYAFRVVDRALNITTTHRHPVSVSTKRLVEHHVTRTLTALASFDAWYTADTCSALTLSTWGPGALHWEACRGGYILSVHELALPDAVAYGSARVSMYGRGRASSTAVLRYVDDHDRLIGAGTRFDATTGTHRAAAIGVTASLLEGHRLRWSIEVIDGDAYGGRTFTVAYTYYRLG